MQLPDRLHARSYSGIFITCRSLSRRFEILDKLGEGHTANVYRIEHRRTKKQFALKAFNHRNFRSTNLIPRKKVVFPREASDRPNFEFGERRIFQADRPDFRGLFRKNRNVHGDAAHARQSQARVGPNRRHRRHAPPNRAPPRVAPLEGLRPPGHQAR